MTTQFDRHGISFLYPEGWDLSEDSSEQQATTITVTNEVGAFWSISRYIGEVKPGDLVETALSALREEYEGLESQGVERELAGVKVVGYEVNFYVQQLIATGRLLGCRRAGNSFLVLCQAEDRDFDELDPVFQAMTISLLQGLDA